MARSFASALALALLAAHLLAAACARHAPAEPNGSGSGRSVDFLYTSSTNAGPSPACGHGNQPSADVALSGTLNGASASEARATFSPIPCVSRGDPPATLKSPDHVKQLSTGDGEAVGVRP